MARPQPHRRPPPAPGANGSRGSSDLWSRCHGTCNFVLPDLKSRAVRGLRAPDVPDESDERVPRAPAARYRQADGAGIRRSFDSIGNGAEDRSGQRQGPLGLGVVVERKATLTVRCRGPYREFRSGSAATSTRFCSGFRRSTRSGPRPRSRTAVSIEMRNRERFPVRSICRR
jgi:hypothetical protein